MGENWVDRPKLNYRYGTMALSSELANAVKRDLNALLESKNVEAAILDCSKLIIKVAEEINKLRERSNLQIANRGSVQQVEQPEIELAELAIFYKECVQLLIDCAETLEKLFKRKRAL